MANRMAEVAKMLGVELEEIFEIKEDLGTKYKFDKDLGRLLCLINNSWWQAPSSTLEALIYGYNTIKRKPWKPKNKEPFYYITTDGRVHCDSFCSDCFFDTNMYKLGNCYLTQLEAEDNRDKWVAFYASDEVLEG